MRANLRPCFAALLFQSTPGTKAGRCMGCKRSMCMQWLFQSTPGTKAGRCRRFCNVLFA